LAIDGVEDVLSGINAGLVPGDLVEHDPHGEHSIEARADPSLPITTCSPTSTFLLISTTTFSFSPDRQHHVAAPAREGAIDAEQHGGATAAEGTGRASRSTAKDGRSACREERLLTVGAEARKPSHCAW
jgi:hypothetical protein